MVDEARDELPGLEIRLVSKRGEAGEAETVVLGEKGELEGEVAALGDEPERAALQLAPAEIEARSRIEDPEAVGPKEDGARVAHPLDDRGLAGTPVGSGLAEAGRDPDERLGSRGQRGLDRLLEAVCGNGEDDELRRLGQVGQGCVCRPLENLPAVSVHEVDRARLLTAQGAERKTVPPLRRVIRRPEDRDGTGVEERAEVPAQDSRRRREMMRRWMSEVPSSISSSFASRIHFSTGYSRE